MASGLPPPSTTTPVPSSSSAAPTVSSLSSSSFSAAKEKTNHIRLSRLLIGVGRCALQDAFDAIHPPSTLNAVLCSGPVHNALSILKSKKILYIQQWDTLYPGSGGSAHASSANFDVTLLCLLLRNICSLAPPATGWGLPPLPSDLSMQADLVRIKLCRNELAHTIDLTLSDASFETNWNDIKAVLIRLGGSKYEAEIERLKVDSIDAECENTFKVLLQTWEEGEEKVLDLMRRLEQKVTVVLQSREEGEQKALDTIRNLEVDSKGKKANPVEIKVKGLVKVVTIGGMVLPWAAASALVLLRYIDDPETMKGLVKEAIIPVGVLTLAGAVVVAIVQGSFVIKIHVSSLEALDQLWESYETGEMERRLETIIVTDDLKGLAPDDVEKITISISISEDDYEKARDSLITSTSTVPLSSSAPTVPSSSATTTVPSSSTPTTTVPSSPSAPTTTVPLSSSAPPTVPSSSSAPKVASSSSATATTVPSSSTTTTTTVPSSSTTTVPSSSSAPITVPSSSSTTTTVPSSLAPTIVPSSSSESTTVPSSSTTTTVPSSSAPTTVPSSSSAPTVPSSSAPTTTTVPSSSAAHISISDDDYEKARGI